MAGLGTQWRVHKGPCLLGGDIQWEREEINTHCQAVVIAMRKNKVKQRE